MPTSDISLRELQTNFAHYVEAVDTMSVLSRLSEGEKLSPLQRMEVYKASIQGTLRKALEEIYPVCRQILGEPLFNKLAQAYFVTHPCRVSDLNAYGQYLPDEMQDKLFTESIGFIVDLARLEWAWHQAINAVDFTIVDALHVQNLLQRGTADISFTLNPALRVIQSDYPVMDIWQAHQDEVDETEIDLNQEQHLAVWRDTDHTLYIQPITAACFRLVTVFLSGMALEPAVDHVSACFSEQETSQSLGFLLQKQLIADIHL